MRSRFLSGTAPIALYAPEGVASGAAAPIPEAASGRPSNEPVPASGFIPSMPASKARKAKPRAPPQFAATLERGDRLIREDECFFLTGLSRTTRWRLEREGKFPKRRQVSDNGVGWLLSEVLAWRDSRPTASTADPGAVAAERAGTGG